MEMEIEMAIRRGHQLFVQNLDGESITGIPEKSDDPGTLKMRTVYGSMWIPLDEVGHLSRLIHIR